uniref:VP n=1 Tax=uncultured densovirus TaxID=748192 RepID=A0A7L7YQK1_9VIRU|nr:VP [uncultured densovirus]
MPKPRNKYPITVDPRKVPGFPKQKDFKTKAHFLNRVKYVWSSWNRARQNRGLSRVLPPLRLQNLGFAVTQKPDGLKTNAAIGFREFVREEYNKDPDYDYDIDDFDEDNVNDLEEFFDKIEVAEDQDSLNTEELESLHQVFKEMKDNNGGNFSISDRDRQDAGPSNAPQQEAPPTEDMGSKRPRTDPAPADASGAVTPAPSGGARLNKGSDGGFDSAQGPMTVLSKGSYQSRGGSMTFKKVHRLKSWAIPYWRLTSTDYGGANIVTTPLAKIPWEYAFFYLSPEEFDLLPSGSYIDSVYIKINQTVASTGYPTGGTTASIATTNHPKVLCIGKDLDAKCRGGFDKLLNLSSELIPNLPAASDPEVLYDEFIKQQYGTDQSVADGSVIIPGAAHKIPFYNRNHFCIYQPNRAQAKDRGFFTEVSGNVTVNNAPGFEYFQNYITELNSNDTTWDTVDEMSYKFENAPIGDQYRQIEILTENFVQSTGSQNRYFNSKRNVTGMNVGGNTSISESIVPSTRNGIPKVTYKSAPMEYSSFYVRGDSAGKPSRQPSFHIGMRAIDKLDPGLNVFRSTNFVQANIEFEIEATMTVNLPSYPNRFMKPKFYNTSIENAAMGINSYPDGGKNRVVTFGILNETNTAPDLAAVDAEDGDMTEDGTRRRSGRPKRSMPDMTTNIKNKRKG